MPAQRPSYLRTIMETNSLQGASIEFKKIIQPPLPSHMKTNKRKEKRFLSSVGGYIGQFNPSPPSLLRLIFFPRE